MASDLQIAANRRNALRSTGPRGTAGKARAASNSTKHGLASDLSRDPKALAAADRLADAIFQSYVGLSRVSARRVAMATFELKNVQKARAGVMESAILGKENSTLLDIDDLLSKLRSIDRYEARAASRKRKALRNTV